MNVEKIIMFEEGFRSKPYLCSEGYVTIGLGTKIYNKKGMNPDDFPLEVTMEAAEGMLRLELDRAHTRIMSSPWSLVYRGMNVARQSIILSMAYQMGGGGVLNFKRMWASLASLDWGGAAMEAIDSKWATQTPARAMRHAEVLRTGKLDISYPDK